MEMLLREAYAQTNLQLYAQLRRAGAAEQDLALVRAGYDLAMHLCPASFRGSGKPLLAHLVGTASILAAMDQSARVVTAGGLHAGFFFGGFGGARGGGPGGKGGRRGQGGGRGVGGLNCSF